jgi:hypothetical protein
MDRLPAFVHDSVEDGGLFSVRSLVRTDRGHSSAIAWELYCRRELAKSYDIPNLMEKILELVNRMGFSDFSFTRMNATSPDQALVTTPRTMSEPWLHRDVWMNDLMLQYGRENSRPIFQTQVDNWVERFPFKARVAEVNKEIRERVRTFGFHEYYCIPFPAANGNGNILFAVTSKDIDVPKFHHRVGLYQAALRVLAQAIDRVATRRFAEFFLGANETKEIKVLPRPLDVLNTMVKFNLSLAETARELGIKESTAKLHMRQLRDALNVHNNTAAAYVAAKEGLLSD